MAADSSLLEHHRKFLRDRAVADDVAAERGYQSVDRKAGLEKLGFGRTQQLSPALVIPVWSVRGVVDSYQLRPDTPRLNEKGKPRKYEQKAGARMLLDAHPRLTRPRDGGRVPLIAVPAVPLFVTEGVPKADAAVSIGLCCIALLGVFNFRGSNEAGGKTALADWESIALNGRTVYIAFDSDAMLNRNVHAALSRLKVFLESRGAIVSLIYLAGGPHGEKVGLDDWIAARKGESLTAADIREALRGLATRELRLGIGEEPRDDHRPEIEIQPGQRPWMVDLAEEVILDYGRWKLFQRGGIVCRVVEIDPSEREKEKLLSIRRPEGAVVLKTVDSITLEDILGRGINWLRRNAKDELVAADCPSKVAATYLSRVGQWRLPVLTGVTEAPTILPDGTIVDSPGYDAESGLFLYSRESWPSVPETPTRAEAEAALRTLREPFDEFPFVSEADRSVILSEILTGLVRRQLHSAPLHGHDAPTQGSGKSLLADCTSLVLTGRAVASMPLGGDAEEVRKRITSILLAGDLIVNIDNIVRPLKSDALAMVLTQPYYADRILGRNERPQLPTNVLWIATGNNLVFAGDLTTRAIVCRIDADVERPEDRSFKISDLRAHVRRERPMLVQAGLTILRAYCVAGRPKQPIERFGRFEQWSDWIRSALIWLDSADPCKTRERITLNDPDRATTATVLAAWHVLFQDQMVLLREVVAGLEPADVGQKGSEAESARAALREAFLNVAASSTNPQKIDTRRLAAWCRGNTDGIAGGLRLTRGDVERHKTATWRVVVSRKGDQTDSTDQFRPESNGGSGAYSDHSDRPGPPMTGTNPSDPRNPPKAAEKGEIDRLARADSCDGDADE